MYTLPKDRVVPEKASRKVLMKIKGYAADECFLYCGTKATNLYSHKNVLVHAFDRYPIQPLKIYLQDYGFPIDADEFALSELIQWIWRSAIRNGEPIKLCLIPPRMKKLFEDWLNGVGTE